MHDALMALHDIAKTPIERKASTEVPAVSPQKTESPIPATRTQQALDAKAEAEKQQESTIQDKETDHGVATFSRADGDHQFRATEARDKNGLLLAPNGKPSKLNERQWHQVRSPEFKAWFGDWELAAQSLRPANNFKEAQEQAKLFQGKKLVSVDGVEATVSRSNLDKMLSASAVHKSESAAEHALAVANLDTLFAQAVTGWVKSDRDGNPNIIGIRRMFAPMLVGDKARLVKLTVKEFAGGHGNRAYSIEAIAVENEASPVPEMVDADRANGSRLLTGPTGLADSVVDRIQEFNRNGSSKVVDENGEPLVLYHGTGADFNTFDRLKSKRGNLGKGFYFTPYFSEANAFAGRSTFNKEGGNVMPVFVSLKNPAIVRGADTGAEDAGYDGIVQVDEHGDVKTIVAFHPEQIKSAIGNIGAFDASNPDIRYSNNNAMSRDTGAGMGKSAIQSVVDAVKQAWNNAPDVVVVEDMHDPAIPQQVRDENDRQLSQGAIGQPEGFFYKGKVYIVAGEMHDTTDVVRVLMHEMLGHYGLRGAFGSELNHILFQSSPAHVSGRNVFSRSNQGA